MSALLPIIAFLLIFLTLIKRFPIWGIRKSYLRAIAIVGVFIVLTTEALSLVNAIHKGILTVAWLGLGIILLIPLVRAYLTGELAHFQIPAFPRLHQRILIALVFLVIITTGFIAWVAPPNTWDSLNYHMARVAHWAQQGSVAHYASGVKNQILMSPGAEFAVLHLYVLGSGDQLVNFVGWFAMVGCLVGVSLIAKHLGSEKNGQLFAVALAVSLPMGIAQATSTMTDYVGGLMIVSVATEVLAIQARNDDKFSPFFLAVFAGLAILVKPTSFAYLLPFGIYMGIILVRKLPLLSILRQAVLAVIIVLILNLGYLTRNYITYQNPMGDPRYINFHSNELKTIPGLISNTLKNASLHAGTPWEKVNNFILRGIIKVHLLMDVHPSDPRTTSIGEFIIIKPVLDENTAGNALHAYFFVLISVLGILTYRKHPARLFFYGLTVISTFLLLSYLFKWHIFSGRFHLPFFLLFCPIAAVVLSRLWTARMISFLGVGFIVLSWPWLFSLKHRPLIYDIRDISSESILRGSRESWYFPRNVGQYQVYKEMSDLILAEGCDDIAMMISGAGAEYPIWVYLGAPRGNLRIEWIISGDPTDKYRDLSFDPCAAICQYCPKDWETFRELPLVYQRYSFRLFLSARRAK